MSQLTSEEKAKSHGTNCAVYGCDNTMGNTKSLKPKVHFYSFPSMKRDIDIERRRKWIRFVGRKSKK